MWLSAGPALALLALLLAWLPATRPRALCRGLCVLGVAMVAPMAIGLAFQSFAVLTIAFVVKPLTAIAGAAMLLGYGAEMIMKRLRVATVLPALLMVAGGVVDLISVSKLWNGWGGASC